MPSAATTTIIRGRAYTVRHAGELPTGRVGECSHPNSPTPSLVTKKGLRGHFRMETILHEGLHASLWDLDEDAVNETAAALADLLWADRWRRVKHV